MVTSQDTAVAVALTELGYDVPSRPEVYRVLPDSPADGQLEAGDELLAINGTRVATIEEAGQAVDATPADEPVELEVRRDGKQRDRSRSRARRSTASCGSASRCASPTTSRST